MSPRHPSVSVVVPVLNEGALLEGFLRRLRILDRDLEIIIVDGGSVDKSVALAQQFADQVAAGTRGRAAQMNTGAALARSEILWFLHADCEASIGAVAQIQAWLSDPRHVGGCFRLRYPRPEWIYRVSDWLGNIGVDLFGFALGDHGIFCRRSAFNNIGGYPAVPILEDAELSRRLRGHGRMRQLPATILSSPRTFEENGRYRTTWIYFLILVLYVCGAPINFLNRIYRHFRRKAPAPVGVPQLAARGAFSK